MIRRLVEAHYVQNRESPGEEKLRFWLRECRTPALLINLAGEYPDLLKAMTEERGLLTYAAAQDHDNLQRALEEEEKREREADRKYWQPLKEELERLRHGNR